MLSKLAVIISTEITVARGGSKEGMGKEMVPGTVAVNKARITSLLSSGIGSASDLDAYMGAAVMIRGRWGVVELVN